MVFRQPQAGRWGVSEAETFWKNVQRGAADECWPWLRSTNGRGYGRLNFRGKHWGAHRVAYTLHHGKEPKLCVLHSCDNPICCNPAHLREGTHHDNMRDMDERGRRVVRRGPTFDEQITQGLRDGSWVIPWDLWPKELRPPCITGGSNAGEIAANPAPHEDGSDTKSQGKSPKTTE